MQSNSSKLIAWKQFQHHVVPSYGSQNSFTTSTSCIVANFILRFPS